MTDPGKYDRIYRDDPDYETDEEYYNSQSLREWLEEDIIIDHGSD